MERHYINLENKQRLTVTEVTGVDAFDEETILVSLQECNLIISGQKLHIEELNLDSGDLLAVGEIEAISYTKRKEKPKLFSRFRK